MRARQKNNIVGGRMIRGICRKKMCRRRFLRATQVPVCSMQHRTHCTSLSYQKNFLFQRFQALFQSRVFNLFFIKWEEKDQVYTWTSPIYRMQSSTTFSFLCARTLSVFLFLRLFLIKRRRRSNKKARSRSLLAEKLLGAWQCAR